jgi:hypothetical protein
MARPFTVLALALLTALLGGPGAGRAVTPPWSPDPTVRQTPAAAPEVFVRANAAWHAGLEVRPRKDHPPVIHGGILAAGVATPSCISGRHAPLRELGRVGAPVPTDPGPTLTTGPPSPA